MKDMFICNGLHFVPAGQINVKSHSEFLSRIFTDTRIRHNYDFEQQEYDEFARMSEKYGSDVFYCLETKTLYVPSPKELFGWRDTVLEAEMNNMYHGFVTRDWEAQKIIANMYGKQLMIVSPDGSKMDFDKVFQNAVATGKINDSEYPFKNVRTNANDVFTVRKMRDFVNEVFDSKALESPIRIRLDEETFVLKEGFNVEDCVVYIGTDSRSRSCSLLSMFNYFRAEEATDAWYKPSLCGDSRVRFDDCEIIICLNKNHYKIKRAIWAIVCDNECIYFEVEKA